MTMTEDNEAETEVGRAAAAIEALEAQVVERLRGGVVDLSEILTLVSPGYVSPPAPAKLPLPAVITDEQRAALERFTEVFGSVVPTERRALTEAEGDALLHERAVIVEVKKLAESREADIKTTVHNAMDVDFEATFDPDADLPEGVYRNKDGHYVVEGEVHGGGDTAFRRGVRAGKDVLDVAALQALADDPDEPCITHAEYLAMTTQTRVVDENKVMLALKSKPHLIEAIRRATVTNPPTAAITVGKRK